MAEAQDIPSGRLTLIGAGHVFQIEEVIRGAVQAVRPDIVFVELDRGRLNGLLHRRRTGEVPTGGGFVQRRLQAFQQRVATQYGGDVGGEMVAAVEAAGQVGARIALIDQSAQVTLRRAIKQLTWRERFRALGMVMASPFKRGGSIDDEVKKYEGDPDAALTELASSFPTIHRVLIQERDALMARRIRRGLQGVGHGLAVVGDGHVPGMLAMLSDLDITTYRLGDVRQGRLPKPAPSADVSFTVHIDGPPQPS